MPLSPLAEELNENISKGNPHVNKMLSQVGQALFFPKGILAQSAEAKQKGLPQYNATIGIARENGGTMYLPSVMTHIDKENLRPQDTLTYASSFGIPALREAWRKDLLMKNPSLKNKSISLPIVTTGITHGISIFSDMFIDPGDRILFPDKMWGNNNLILSVRRGAVIVQYPFFEGNRAFNLMAFKQCIQETAPKTQKLIVVLNFPNNPTGYTITAKEGDGIRDILFKAAENGTHIITLNDDAYFGLRYDDNQLRESLFTRLCDLHPRILAVKLDGATKEMFVWGLRVGFMTYGTVVKGEKELFYDALVRKTAGNVRGSVSNACHMSQTIVLNALKAPQFETDKASKIDILRKRAQKVKAILSTDKYADAWEMYPFNSGYFMCLKLKTVDAEALRIHVLDKYGVGLISINNEDIRFAFSSVDIEDLEAVFDYIHQGVKDLES